MACAVAAVWAAAVSDRFADDFWRFDPQERYRRWQELMVRCETSPPLRFRLRQLGSGLQVGPACLGDDDARVTELIGQIQDLFVLRPVARAERRLIFRRKIRSVVSHQAKNHLYQVLHGLKLSKQGPFQFIALQCLQV